MPASISAAPWAFNALAIAPPMPPEAPVTNAVWPDRSNIAQPYLEIFEQRLCLRRGANGARSERWGDAFGEPGEYATGADLDDLLDP